MPPPRGNGLLKDATPPMASLGLPGGRSGGSLWRRGRAVGNGVMWVTDDGRRGIEPGDYLISSDVPGCAMLDDPTRFLVGHIVAQAGARVDWSDVQPDDRAVKRVKIAVQFERFDRQGDARAVTAELDRLRAENETQRRRLEYLQQQMRILRRALPQPGLPELVVEPHSPMPSRRDRSRVLPTLNILQTPARVHLVGGRGAQPSSPARSIGRLMAAAPPSGPSTAIWRIP